MAKTLNEWTKDIHQNAVAHGWWDEARSFGDIGRCATASFPKHWRNTAAASP